MRRQHFLYGAQKLVQARMYAQAATIAMILATAAVEYQEARQGKGKYRTVEVVEVR